MTRAHEIQHIIAAVAQGDRRAFAELYRLSSPKLYGIILRMLRQKERAAHAMRVTYARIYAQAGQYRDNEDPVCWLVAIARASALDLAREQEVDAFEPFAVETPAHDPLARPQRSPALRRLLSCLGALSEERRRVVLLAFYDGWSRNALSLYFDAPIATIKVWVARSTSEIAHCIARRP